MKKLSKEVRAAAYQMEIADEADVEKHTQLIVEGIKKASENKADIICFPETCLYSVLEVKPPTEKSLGMYFKTIFNACAEYKIWAVVTSYITENNKMYNRNYLINRRGEVVYKYDKVFLWPSERKYVTPGKSNKVIRTELGNLVTITCFDTFFPEYSKKLAKEGAQIFLVPTYLVESTSPKACQTVKMHRSLGLIRAYETGTFWIKADPLHPRTIGNSSICSPSVMLAEATPGKSEIIYADLIWEHIEEFRKYMNFNEKVDYFSRKLPKIFK